MTKPGDAELLQKLQTELERLDELYDEISLPPVADMERFVAEELLRRQRRQRRELLLFIMAALVLLSIFLAVLGYAPVLFLLLQIAFPAVVLLGLGALRLARRREGADE
ncbi:DUF5345 family protein [Paenibacillus tengchongensis]|uniref:DUF5345 family protein n=1 Tax=Paenibacillus tengchongensis TaxID=2608684 RepID=UPI00124E0615|nr:DUF5345 family protein [Paenibacillus tengchongensis]